MRATWLLSESSKRSTGVARDFRTGSPRRLMNDIAAARRAASSGSSGVSSSSSSLTTSARLVRHGGRVYRRERRDVATADPRRPRTRPRACARSAATVSTAARTASMAGGALGRPHHELRAVAAAAPEEPRRAEHGHPGGRDQAHAPRRPPPSPARAPRRSTPPAPAGRRADSRRPRCGRARPRGSPRSRAARRGRSTRAVGSSACTITRPPRSPRPLRPASWATSAKVRSSARKSGKRSVESASSTTASVTAGKSWPLATICVPTSTPAGRRVERAQHAAGCPRRP